MVMVAVPLLPWVTFSEEGLAEIEKLPVPELVPPTLTDTTPEEAANIAPLGYWAIIWCVPAVEKEAGYVAVAVPGVLLAFSCAVVVVPLYAVPPSICSVTEPEGVAVPLAATTVMVKVSLVLTAGVEFVALIVVEVPTRVEVFAVHTPARLARSIDPSPVTKS
jgi:hypothetical protein